jgi:outer membrane protein TolC
MMMLVCLGWAALAAPLTADEVVAAALSRDPALAEAEANVLAAEGERCASTGLRHDPTLQARVGFGLPQHEASLTQPLSLSGEGLAAAKAADASLKAALAQRDRRRLEVAAAARKGMIWAIAAEASVARADEILRLTADLRVTAEARLAAGDGTELEVHLARLEEAAAAADQLAARRDALSAREALAATTGFGPDAALPDDPMVAAPSASAGGERSDRVAAAAHLERADAELRRERAAALPPVDVGVWLQVQNVGVTPGPGGVAVAPWSWSENAAWSVGPSLSMALPLWHGNPDGVARATGARDVAAVDLGALDARIAAEERGVAARQRAVDGVAGVADPTSEAQAALVGIDAAIAAGEIGVAEGSLLRARILDAWNRGAAARAEAAVILVDVALVASWPTLAPAAAPTGGR